MSFAPAIHKFVGDLDPLKAKIFGQKFADNTDLAYSAFGPKTPPQPPGVPNPNDAANAAQATTDQMRQRRGLLANIYGGALNQSPVTGGKTSLGT